MNEDITPEVTIRRHPMNFMPPYPVPHYWDVKRAEWVAPDLISVHFLDYVHHVLHCYLLEEEKIPNE